MIVQIAGVCELNGGVGWRHASGRCVVCEGRILVFCLFIPPHHPIAEIGIHFPQHLERAIAIGEKLGAFRDYPTPKGCTSPFAPIWIAEMVRRQG